jgi:hypothetical protein
MGQARPGAALWTEDVDVLVGAVANRECDIPTRLDGRQWDPSALVLLCPLQRG